jgi:hypothetical protein
MNKDNCIKPFGLLAERVRFDVAEKVLNSSMWLASPSSYIMPFHGKLNRNHLFEQN